MSLFLSRKVPLSCTYVACLCNKPFGLLFALHHDLLSELLTLFFKETFHAFRCCNTSTDSSGDGDKSSQDEDSYIELLPTPAARSKAKRSLHAV